MTLRLLERVAAMGTRDPHAGSGAPLWLKMLAGVVLLPGFWVSILFAAIAILPASIFPRSQVLVQVASLLPAGALAWLTVRRAPSLLLVLLIPLLLVLYLIALDLMANLPGRG
jgi:hypothetical protein